MASLFVPDVRNIRHVKNRFNGNISVTIKYLIHQYATALTNLINLDSPIFISKKTL